MKEKETLPDKLNIDNTCPPAPGKAELFCGDNIEIMSAFDLESIDLTVTSPPYDKLREYKGYSFDFESTAKELFRITKKGGVVVWVVGDSTLNGSESGTSFKQALYFKEIGFNLHDTMIYQKINYVPLTHNRYEQCFEYMFILSKGKPRVFNPIMIPCKNPGKYEKYSATRRQSRGINHSMRLYDETIIKLTKESKIAPNIFQYTIGKEKTGHPAVFPEKLAEDQIITWSNKDDIIFDPFMGSGTTGKMAIKNMRKFKGIDVSQDYVDMSKKRIYGEI